MWSLILSSLGLVAAVPLGMLVATAFLWPLSSIVSDVSQLPMLVRLQPWRTAWRLGLVAGGFLFVLDLALGPGHVPGKVLAAIVLAARPTLWLVRHAL